MDENCQYKKTLKQIPFIAPLCDDAAAAVRSEREREKERQDPVAV
jgi:hypothetical protein